MVCAALHNFLEKAGAPRPSDNLMPGHVPTTLVEVGTTGGRPRQVDGNTRSGSLVAANDMRSHLAKHVASITQRTPVE